MLNYNLKIKSSRKKRGAKKVLWKRNAKLQLKNQKQENFKLN